MSYWVAEGKFEWLVELDVFTMAPMERRMVSLASDIQTPALRKNIRAASYPRDNSVIEDSDCAEFDNHPGGDPIGEAWFPSVSMLSFLPGMFDIEQFRVRLQEKTGPL